MNEITPRFSRQLVLPEIGVAGQEKLANTRVLIVGIGGLGCPVALYLAGAGVGMLGIIDSDRVDLSNLQRQILFTMEDQGRSKAEAARERLLALNPDIGIRAYDEELTAENALSLFSGYDAIVDGTDNFATKFLINDVAVKLGKPYVYAAIQGFDAQVSVFATKEGPCYRCLHPKKPESAIMNCAEAGIIGPVSGIAGTVQALEVIKLVVGHESFNSLAGRLWLCDTRTMESRVIGLPKNVDCPVCAKPPEEIIPQYASPVCYSTMAPEIECADKAIYDAVLIDVREREEWDAGHIEGACHLPLSALQANPALFTAPENDRLCVLYCQKGMRSRRAAEILTQSGHSNLYSLKGGYEAWCRNRQAV